MKLTEPKRLKTFGVSGFALIVTLTLMVLLLILAVGLLSLSAVQLRSSGRDSSMALAQSNARMALMLAIGELQKAAGPDQRITAGADMLSGSAAATAGRAHWTGVWNTENYSPKTPNKREFVRWLVSSPDPDVPPVPGDLANADDLLIFEGKDAAASVKVPRVKTVSTSGAPGAYAYWVEDEGIKADLAWSQGNFTTDERSQAARLSTAPGPDYKTFEGPFNGKVSYPVKRETGNTWLANMGKALSVEDIPLVLDATANQSTWFREKRHDITLGSLGVMADAKLGGLRRDLSLAFEMDGVANLSSGAANHPKLFNQQYGEFVGHEPGIDPLTAEFGVDGLIARYVYGDKKNAGLTFSSDIGSTDAVIRGPSWWALRDYANSYKRLSGNFGNYEIKARAYYPNHGAQVDGPIAPIQSNVGTLADVASAQNLSDKNIITGGIGNVFYVEKPFETNVTPVLLGYTSLLSVLSSGNDPVSAKLALGLDPIFYLWNPYNHRLKADRFAIAFRAGLPGQIKIWVNGSQRRAEYVQDYISQSAGVGTKNVGYWLSYSIKDVDLAPGEVKIYSPPVNAAKVSANSSHPYNTDAFEGADLSAGSGALITRFPAAAGGNAWGEILLSSVTSINVGFAMTGSAVDNQISTSMPPVSTKNSSLSSKGNFQFWVQSFLPRFAYSAGMTQIDHFQPAKAMGSMAIGDAAGPYSGASILGSKQFCGVFSLLTAPANFSGPKPNPVENFAQFNPFAIGSLGKDGKRVAAWNQEAVAINKDFSTNYSGALEATGVVLPSLPGLLANGYWGANYGDSSGVSGSTSVPMLNIPTEPLFSMAQFSHANLSIRAEEPLNAVGSSWASIFVNPVSTYGALAEDTSITSSDMPWLINDALFDRYYLSGIAPEFSIGPGGYSTGGKTVKDTLDKFFQIVGTDYRTAQASPVLRPYLPKGTIPQQAVSRLNPNSPDDHADGYRKMAAYTLIDGVFNVNSTSLAAWTALLRANRSLPVAYAQGGSNNGSNDTPFPRGTSPVSSGKSAPFWSGVSRLSDSQIDSLATEIVKQVKLRGPFMSLSDFVNHRVGSPVSNDTHYLGALQAAIEKSGINSSVHAGAGGTMVNYATSPLSASFSSPISGNRPTTTGIVTAITQADLLQPLAPRLGARSDTFRIRAYGEALSKDGTKVLARATCEAVVQRTPEYVDTSDEPWIDPNADPYAIPAVETLNETNKIFGRRFQIVGFRWLNPDEI
ncbi:MAG: hypothetical protein ABJQ29_03740 [Luteolibacter sp.]